MWQVGAIGVDAGCGERVRGRIPDRLYLLEVSNMSIYPHILRQYEQRFKSGEFQKYEIGELTHMTDQLAKINCDYEEFDPAIRQEVLDILPVTYDKKVILRDFISTILKVYDIISQYISQAEKNLPTLTDPHDIQILRSNILQFSGTKQYLCNVFCLPTKPQSKLLIKLQTDQQSQYAESVLLKSALVILLLALVVELLLMLYRFTFLNCLVYVLGLAIFVLNFFDRAFIRFVICALSISVVLDVIWSIAAANLYTHSHQSSFVLPFGTITSTKLWLLKVTYYTTILLAVAKCILVAILWRFRNNTVYTKKSVRVGQWRIKLEIKPEVSPISRFMMKKQSGTQQQRGL